MVSGAQPDTRKDVILGHEEGHGIVFCTMIQAVHKRTRQLFGLRAIGPGDPYKLSRISNSEFQQFFDMMAAEGQRHSAWDMYYAGLQEQGCNTDPLFWVHRYGRQFPLP